jgi:hypothetical protein
VFKHFAAQLKIVVEELSAVTAEAVEEKQAKEEVRATATKLDGKREAAETAAAKQAEIDVAARKETDLSTLTQSLSLALDAVARSPICVRCCRGR